jgi:hypothetical protein
LQGQQRRVAHVAHWQSRWLSPMLYWLCLGAGPLAESYIAMLVWVLLFTLLWRRYARRACWAACPPDRQPMPPAAPARPAPAADTQHAADRIAA